MSDPTTPSRLALGLLLAAHGLSFVSGLFVGLTPASEQLHFSTTTWGEFAAAFPQVAHVLTGEVRLVGIGYTSFSALGLFLTLGPLRQGDRWGWTGQWLIVATYVATIGSMGITNPIASVYALFTVLSAVGLFLARSALRTPAAARGEAA